MPIHPKTKEKVTWREFFRQWKRGMEQITPLQQTQIIQLGHLIALVGVIWGMVFSIRIGYTWMSIVLGGGLFVLVAQYLGNYQKKVILRTLDNQIKLAEEEMKNGREEDRI